MRPFALTDADPESATGAPIPRQILKLLDALNTDVLSWKTRLQTIEDKLKREKYDGLVTRRYKKHLETLEERAERFQEIKDDLKEKDGKPDLSVSITGTTFECMRLIY